jgi:arsenate reductase-like glutaredoxin family protein
MNNLPDNYIPENLISDAEYEYACVKYKTDIPTNQQLQEAAEEMANAYEEYLQNRDY